MGKWFWTKYFNMTASLIKLVGQSEYTDLIARMLEDPRMAENACENLIWGIPTKRYIDRSAEIATDLASEM